MRSFEHGCLYEAPLSHALVMAMRALGEFRGRQVLYARQSPEVLETLRRAAAIQSAESSNRIEGIVMAPERLPILVAKKTKPRDRSEQEIAGYRDVLADIHANRSRLALSPDLILSWHRSLYRFTDERGGQWKKKDNAIMEVRPDGRQVVRFQPTSALATPKFMGRLIALFNQDLAKSQADPLLLIASFILDFECIHPFKDGNGRIGRLLTLLLLYQSGYEAGRYISLERIVEQSKETYYEALLKSSQGWHDGQHDLRPWWNYFLGMLTAAYKDFEDRVGAITSARGAKSAMVQSAIQRLPQRFTLSEIQQACPSVSRDLIRLVLRELKKEGLVECLGRGPGAPWAKRGRIPKKG